ncbi:MAG: hypothetical protein WCJ31_06065 [Planctomycetia bacterium]
MADDQGARPDPEISLPIRVIRSGQIVYQVGSLGELVRLAATNKLLPIDKIAGPPEFARALAEQEYWLRYEVYGFPFILMCLGPMMTIGLPDIVLDVRKWLAGGMENGDFVLLLPVFYFVSFLIVAMMWLVLNARYRRILQQLRLSLAGDGLQPGNPIDLYAVPEIARALADREELWLRHDGRALTILAMFFGLLFLSVFGLSWLAGGLEKGDVELDLSTVFFVVPFIIILILVAHHRHSLQQLRRSLAGGGPRPG